MHCEGYFVIEIFGCLDLWQPNSLSFRNLFLICCLTSQKSWKKRLNADKILCNVQPGIHVVMRPRRRPLGDCLLSTHAASSEIHFHWARCSEGSPNRKVTISNKIERIEPAGAATGSLESKSWGEQVRRGDWRLWTSGRHRKSLFHALTKITFQNRSSPASPVECFSRERRVQGAP